jgi:hypothetical protein
MQAPVLIWNATHDWASFAFQAGRGIRETLGLDWLRESVLGQSAYLLPWIVLPLLIVLVRAIVAGPRNERRWLLACLAILPIVIFTALTLFSRGLPHWQMPGWLFAIPLLGEALAQARPWLRRLALGVSFATALILVVLGGAFTLQARWGTFDETVQQMFGREDPSDIILSWDSLPDELAQRGLPADERTFIVSFNWITAAHLNVVFGTEVPVVCLCGDARHFAYLHEGEDFTGWTALIIDQPNRVERRAESLVARFGSLSPVETVAVKKGERAALELALQVGTGFRP